MRERIKSVDRLTITGYKEYTADTNVMQRVAIFPDYLREGDGLRRNLSIIFSMSPGTGVWDLPYSLAVL